MDDKMIEILQEYFKNQPVEKAWIFGSFSRGEERSNSDVDIMVTLIPDAHMGLSWFAMICDLEERLGRNVDLVLEGELLPFATESANNDKRLVYERSA